MRVRREAHRPQSRAAGEGIVGDRGDSRAEIHGLELRVARKGVAGHGAVQHRHGPQAVHVAEDIVGRERLARREGDGEILDGAFGEGVGPDLPEHRGEGQIGQSAEAIAAVGHGLVPQLGDRPAERQRLQSAAGADIQGVGFQLLDARVDRQRRQARAAVQEVLAEGLDGVRHREGVQGRAAGEGIAAHRRHAAPELRGAEARAALEAVVSDSGGEPDRVQGRTAGEGIAAEAVKASGHGQQHPPQRAAAAGKIRGQTAQLRRAQVDQAQGGAARKGVRADARDAARQRNRYERGLVPEGLRGDRRHGTAVDRRGNAQMRADALAQPRDRDAAVVVRGIVECLGRVLGILVVIVGAVRADIGVGDGQGRDRAVGLPDGVVAKARRGGRTRLDTAGDEVPVLILPMVEGVAQQRVRTARHRQRVAALAVDGDEVPAHVREEVGSHVPAGDRAEIYLLRRFFADLEDAARRELQRAQIGRRAADRRAVRGRDDLDPVVDRVAVRLCGGQRELLAPRDHIVPAVHRVDRRRISVLADRQIRVVERAAVGVEEADRMQGLGLGVEVRVAHDLVGPLHLRLRGKARVGVPADQLQSERGEIEAWNVIHGVRVDRGALEQLLALLRGGQQDVDGLSVVGAELLGVGLVLESGARILVGILRRPFLLGCEGLDRIGEGEEMVVRLEEVDIQQRRPGGGDLKVHGLAETKPGREADLNDHVHGDLHAVEHVEVDVVAELYLAQGHLRQGGLHQEGLVDALLPVCPRTVFQLELGLRLDAEKGADRDELDDEDVHVELDLDAEFQFDLRLARQLADALLDGLRGVLPLLIGIGRRVAELVSNADLPAQLQHGLHDQRHVHDAAQREEHHVRHRQIQLVKELLVLAGEKLLDRLGDLLVLVGVLVVKVVAEAH